MAEFNATGIEGLELSFAEFAAIPDETIEQILDAEDWGNQTQVVYAAKTYDILRAYQKGLGIVELSCTDKAK